MEGSSWLVIGLGELVWDLYPDGPRLGGAPANVAHHATVLGDRGAVATVVGRDELGQRALALLRDRGVETTLVQQHPKRSTGTVQVDLSLPDEPRYNIDTEAAWTRPGWSAAHERLLCQAGALIFGSLLCSTTQGRELLQRAAAALPPTALRLCDLNLRPPWSSWQGVEAALDCANVVKLNSAEAALLGEQHPGGDVVASLLGRPGMRAVALTLGAGGSELHTPDGVDRQPGLRLDTSRGDPVGAGDAFSAALTHHLLRGTPLGRTNRAANHYAAHVAALRGATPRVAIDVVRQTQQV